MGLIYCPVHGCQEGFFSHRCQIGWDLVILPSSYHSEDTVSLNNFRIWEFNVRNCLKVGLLQLQQVTSVDKRPKSQQSENKRHGILPMDPRSIAKGRPEVFADKSPSLVPSVLIDGGKVSGFSRAP